MEGFPSHSSDCSGGLFPQYSGVSPLKGQHDWGQQDREPLRGKSASEREGFQRFSEVFQRSSDSPSQAPSPVALPLIVLPLELSPSVAEVLRVQQEDMTL